MSKKKKVLLLNPPYSKPIMRDTLHPTSKSALYIWHPLDLLIHSGYLTDFDVRLHDGVVNNSPAALKRLLDDFKPDGILSLIAYPTINKDIPLLQKIKKEYGSKIWCVGDVTYGQKEKFLEEYPFIDGVMSDYTSKAFSQYMRGDAIRNGFWREDGVIKSDKTQQPLDWDVPRHDLLDLSKYYLPYWKPPFGSIYATHGCPAKCSFCVVPGWGPSRFRKHEAIIEELDFLDHLGVNKVFFRDGSFNQAPKYTIDLCEKIASRFGNKFKFTTWFKPRPLDDRMARVMKAAGFQYVHMGVETGSADLLRRFGKDFEFKDVEPGIEILHNHGIKVVGHFLIGPPGETEEDFQLTAKYLRKTNLDVISPSVFEYSFGIEWNKDNSAPLLVSDEKKLRRRLYYLMLSFYLRPGRWRHIYFFEDLSHLLKTIPRGLQYLAALRLYPRFKELE